MTKIHNITVEYWWDIDTQKYYQIYEDDHNLDWSIEAAKITIVDLAGKSDFTTATDGYLIPFATFTRYLKKCKILVTV